MALNDDAVKAAAEALSEHYEGDGWGYFGGAAEAAVAAAAPILLADAQAEIERLRDDRDRIRLDRDEWRGRAERAAETRNGLAMEIERWVRAHSTLVKEQAQERVESAAEVERWQRALVEAAIYVEAARAEEAAAERARIAAAIRAAGHADGYHRVDTTREWAGIYCADCAVTERSARIAETAPEEES